MPSSSEYLQEDQRPVSSSQYLGETSKISANDYLGKIGKYNIQSREMIPNTRLGTLERPKRKQWLRTAQGDINPQSANTATGIGEKYIIPALEKIVGVGSMGLIEPGSSIGANPEPSGRSGIAKAAGTLIGAAVPFGSALKVFEVPASAPLVSKLASGAVSGATGYALSQAGEKSPITPEGLAANAVLGGTFGAAEKIGQKLFKIPQSSIDAIATVEAGGLHDFGLKIQQPKETPATAETPKVATPTVATPKEQPSTDAGVERLMQKDVGYSLDDGPISIGKLPTQEEFGAPKEYPKTVGLANAVQDEFRKVVGGFDDLPESIRISWSQDGEKAVSTGMVDKASEIAQDLISTRRPHTSTEEAAMTIRLARVVDESRNISQQIDDAIAKGDFELANTLDARHEALHNEMATISDAARVSGSETGRALNIRKMQIATEEPYSVQSLVRKATVKKGSALTPEEVSKYEGLAKENAQLQEKLRIATEQESEKIAALEKKLAERQVSIEASKSRIKGVADVRREKVVESRNRIKKQLRDLGYRVNDITGVTPEGAYWLGRLAATYVQEGAITLNEVVQKVMADVPNITERDVWESLNARNPKAIAKARDAAEKRLAEIRRSGRLAVELDDLSKGIWRTPQSKGPLSQSAAGVEMRGILKKLDDLKTQLRLRGQDPAQVRAAHKQIDELKQQLVKGYRRVKSYPDEATASLKSAREAMAGLRKQLGEQDTIAKLENQLSKYEQGIFPTTKSRGPLPDAIRSLQKRLREVKSQAYRTGTDGAKREKIIQKTNALRAQLDGFYRSVKKGKPISTEDLKQAQQVYADLKKLMNATDELTNLQDQLKTGNFVIKSRVQKPVSPELEKIQIELTRARRRARMEIEAQGRKTTVGSVAKEVGNTVRALVATADMSGFRQNIMAVLSHPIEGAKAFTPAAKAFFKNYTAEQIDNSIQKRPNFLISQKAGLKHIELESNLSSQQNEFFQSKWVEKIPGLGEVAKASNRHMTTLGNLMRSSLFDDFVMKNPAATDAELKAYADFINVGTGIGNLRKFSQAAENLGVVFFSPKLAVSRFQTPYKLVQYWKMPLVRKQIARDLAGFVATGSAILGVAKLIGAEVSSDPESPDFGRIRVGDTRYDIWGGFQPAARLVYRLGKAGIQGATLTDEQKRKLVQDPIQTIEDFTTFKFSPSITIPRELVTGKTAVGEPTTISETFARSVIPMWTRDVYDAMRGETSPIEAVGSLSSFFGAGVSTYKDKESVVRKRAAEMIGRGDIEGARKMLLEWIARNNSQ